MRRLTWAQLRLPRMSLNRQRLRCNLISVRLQVSMSVWDDRDLRRAVLGRLRRKASDAETLNRVLLAPPLLLKAVLGQLEALRQISEPEPGIYLALPWERLKQVEVIVPGSGTDYQSLSTAFWVHHGAVPTADQEPHEGTRQQVEVVLLKLRQEEELRVERQRCLAVQKERIRARLLQAKWLIPSGNLGLLIEGISCRIDVGSIPDGRLWTFKQLDGQVISAKVASGILLTQLHGQGGWTRVQESATLHFGAARAAHLERRLQAFELGREVLEILLDDASLPPS